MTTFINNPSASVRTKGPDRFFIWAAISFAVLAIIGFSRTYYLKTLFGTPALSGLIHIHAVIMTAWLVLLITQTLLIANRRLEWHRRLGICGAVLALLVVAVGMHATVMATEQEVRHHIVGRFHFLLALNAANLLAFGALVIAAIAFRSRGAFHKRLMLMATLNLIAPALARIVLLFTHQPGVQIYFFYSCIVAFVIADTVVNRRLHPASLWGAVFSIGVFQLSIQLVKSSFWLPFVDRSFS